MVATSGPPVSGADEELVGSGDGDVTPPMESQPDPAFICPECTDANGGVPVAVPPNGKWTPAAVVGAHRRKEHGVVGKSNGKSKRRKKTLSEAPSSVTPIRRSIGAEVQAEVGSGKRPPTGDQLTRAFAKLDGYATTFIVGAIVDRDPRNLDIASRDQLVEEIVGDTDDMLASWHPIARRLAGTSLNKRYGRDFVDNLDIADAVVAIAERYRRLADYMSRRQAPMVQLPGMVVPVPADSGSLVDPRTQSGRVVTPDMLDHPPGAAPTVIPGAGPDG